MQSSPQHAVVFTFG